MDGAWRFYEGKGLIWADAGEQWPAFKEALADSVTSLSPRGKPARLSTYWIDQALKAETAAVGEAFTGGNATELVRTTSGVRAESLYETFEPEEMPLDVFLEGIRTWRDKVEERGAVDLPDLAPYQRNPADSRPPSLHLEFSDPELLPHDAAEVELQAGLSGKSSDHDPNEVLVGLALYDPDREFVERWCVDLGTRATDPQLRATAALCIGHLARRFGLVSDEARNLVERLANDANLDGRRLDALADVQQFAG